MPLCATPRLHFGSGKLGLISLSCFRRVVTSWMIFNLEPLLSLILSQVIKCELLVILSDLFILAFNILMSLIPLSLPFLLQLLFFAYFFEINFFGLTEYLIYLLIMLSDDSFLSRITGFIFQSFSDGRTKSWRYFSNET